MLGTIFGIFFEMRSLTTLCLIAIIAALSCANISQVFYGYVRDSSSQPISGAEVKIKGYQGTNVLKSITTDSTGYFSYSGDRFILFNGGCGIYFSIEVIKSGYKTYTEDVSPQSCDDDSIQEIKVTLTP